MGNVGIKGFKEFVPVKVGRRMYYYDPFDDVWYDSGGEKNPVIELGGLDGLGRISFDAETGKFVDNLNMVLPIEKSVQIEGMVKEKYGLDGEVSFYRPD